MSSSYVGRSCFKGILSFRLFRKSIVTYRRCSIDHLTMNSIDPIDSD